MIALMFCGAVVAQRADRRPKNPNDVATMQSERMKKSLNLSDEQFASVKSTNLKFAERISQLRSDTTMSRETRHQKMTELRNQKQSEIEAILTAEQKSTWEAERRTAARGDRGKMAKVPHVRNDVIMDSLSLTDDQSAKLETAQEKFRTKLSAIRKEDLPEDQRKTKLKEARAEHDQSVRSILSDEQYIKWKELKKDRSHKRLKQEHYHKK